ncbi:MAG: TetR/AcrR family transcriptional regulator [Deltaproteobacteria bacterium]|nr:TetR/AcrR family transcriptional regulator [Deltaproteobacteria bacterium]MBM4323488.1 TetR/AcrR family transcriptional regulator [Deltaproteobacteria bacterium]
MEAKKTFFNLPEEKQKRVLEAALEEFSEKGFNGASINLIVSKLGIAKGSIYQYFTDKKSLFLHIFDYAVELIRKRLKQVKQETKEEPAFERIKRSLLAGVDFIEHHPFIYRGYLKMMFEREVPFRQELLQKIRLFSSEYLTSLLIEGQEKGEIRGDVNLETMVFLLDAVMDRFLQAYAVPYLNSDLHIHGAKRAELERMIDGLVDTIRKGIGK